MAVFKGTILPEVYHPMTPDNPRDGLQLPMTQSADFYRPTVTEPGLYSEQYFPHLIRSTVILEGFIDIDSENSGKSGTSVNTPRQVPLEISWKRALFEASN